MEQLNMLLSYQELDLQAAQIEGKLKDSQVRQRLVKARNYLVESQKRLQRYDSDINELQMSLKAALGRYEESAEVLEDINSAIEHMNENSSLKEADMLKRNVKEQQNNLARLEKDIKMIMENLEKMESQIKSMAANIPKVRKDYEELKKVYDKEHNAVMEEVEPIRQKLSELEKKIDKNTVARFKKIKKSHAIPVVEMMGSKCTGCNMDLSSVMAKKVAESNTLLECENCGRMLYVKK